MQCDSSSRFRRIRLGRNVWLIMIAALNMPAELHANNRGGTAAATDASVETMAKGTVPGSLVSDTSGRADSAARQSVALEELSSINDVAIQAELKTVKLYGAGGVAGLDAYQSGFYISGEGHVLTVWSTVLDVTDIIVVGSDGRRSKGRVLGIDPNLEIAVLETDQEAIHYFDLENVVEGAAGERVLAVSNLYGIATGREMSSVQHGVIMAETELNARRGTFESTYQGPVYVIDAMSNNPGAAGGALTNIQGELLGILGKELRDTQANIWLNYAIPVSQIRESVARIREGKSIIRSEETRKPVDRPASLAKLGVVMIPDVVSKTPAFVDLVHPGSPAAEAGLRPDDLILFMNSIRIASQADLRQELQYIDEADGITMLIQRDQELIQFVLEP